MSLYKKENLRRRHYFNDIPYTKWPFFISTSLLCFIFFLILYLNKYSEISILMVLVPFFCMFYYIMEWFLDMDTESVYLGRYNTKVKSSIVFGFFIFLASEALLFGGFFWCFFDRAFHTSYSINDSFVHEGVELVRWTI